jgi:two-component system OmpR family response regulator
MPTANKTVIFLVDDDALFLKNLEIHFKQSDDFEIHTYSTGERCLENLYLKPTIIVLDYYLNGIDKNAMNGIQVLDSIKDADPAVNVIMLSSQDKIEVAIDCMHHQAYDYVVKSETALIRLQKAITSILQNQKMKRELNWYMSKL